MSSTNGNNGNGKNGNGNQAPDATVESELRQDLERGLQFANVISSVNMDQNKENIACVQALANLLLQKGIVSKEEVTESVAEARKKVAERPMPGVRLLNIGDKYAEGQAVEVDCASLIHLCHARCCTFKFFLTKQDLDEGTARWDYGNPYWIRQGQDGYCVHSDPQTRACGIHAKRPHVCRAYDCRNDKRVWIDFENRIPAPMPEGSGCSPVAMAEAHMRHWGTAEEAENATIQPSEQEQEASK